MTCEFTGPFVKLIRDRKVMAIVMRKGMTYTLLSEAPRQMEWDTVIYEELKAVIHTTYKETSSELWH